jgi:hypothetical protein
MKTGNKVIIVIIALVLLFTAGTVSFILLTGKTAVSIKGFAVLNHRDNATTFLSPEGFYYQVHIEENYPLKDFQFWYAALKKKMDIAGYTPLFEEVLSTGGNMRCYMEWGAPYGNEDYVYMINLIVCGNKLIIGEAAGEITQFQKYRSPIIESLKTKVY